MSRFPHIVSAAVGLCLLAAGPTVPGPTWGSPSPPRPAPDPLEPARAGGLEVIDRALAKLSTTARLLVVGAHPDDEDTSLLTLVARGLGGEAAYLSLSRGEGGQNLIGPELGEALGVLRTQELLAARRVDGARQFFTRAYDFGYTRSLDETLERWPREVLLEDAVGVVRRFRPQVIVAMFSPEIGGHGQHLASGWVAERVFEAAGDPQRFPGVGGEPWRPTALYRRTWFDPESADFEVPLARLDPLTGRSMVQIAMASRSRHRSQDMGSLEPLGARSTGLQRIAGEAADDGGAGLFAGADVDLASLASELPEESRPEGERRLRAIERAAHDARRALSPADSSAVVPSFVSILEELGWVRDRLPAGASRVTVQEKIAIASTGLAAASGVAIDATTSREAVAPGQSADVAVSVWDAGEVGVEIVAIDVVAGSAWRIAPAKPDEPDESGEQEERRGPDRSGENGVESHRFTAAVVPGASPTVPYYLEATRLGDLYDWGAVPESLRGEPERAPELVARVRLVIAGVEIELEREVVWRGRDQAVGEIRRPVRIVPLLEIAAEAERLPWRVASSDVRRMGVIVVSHADESVSGKIVAHAPEGWSVTSPEFSIDEPGGSVELDVAIAPAGVPEPGRSRLELAVELDGYLHSSDEKGVPARKGLPDREEGPGDGAGRLARAVPLVDYPHIHPRAVPVPSEVELVAIDLELPEGRRVGYVDGAADRMPPMLAAAGLGVEPLTGASLAALDLSLYDAIVIGPRAYETDPALAGANQHLLDWMRAGGTLVVQYQQYDFFRGGFAPHRLEIARRHDRITDETSPVELLDPEHPVFHHPNELGPADWDGWVQERGLYFASAWDEAYAPLLAMRDPGGEEQRGGLLVARYGEGHYVYSGLAFFRQLPAGVPGAFRLLANLIALGEPPAAASHAALSP